MVNEVIKAVASATVGGVSLVATAPTLTVVDASTTVGEIVAVQFSSIEPNVNTANYGIDNLTEVSTVNVTFYIVVRTKNIDPGYQLTFNIDESSTVDNSNLVGLLRGRNYDVTLNTGLNGECFGYITCGTTPSVHVPTTYDLRITKDYNGTSELVDGKYIKRSVSLYKVFQEQIGGEFGDNDTFNLTVDPDVAVIGDYQGWASDTSELDTSVINMNHTNIDSYLTVTDKYNEESYILQGYRLWHSRGDYTTHTKKFIMDLKKRYGTVQVSLLTLHGTAVTIFNIRNADGSLASTATHNTGPSTSRTVSLTFTKGQYLEVEYTYTVTSIDSKNVIFYTIDLYVHNGLLTPALLVSSKFNETHTVNIINNGMILGRGGDARNHTPQANITDLYQTEIVSQVPDAYPRLCNGGDAIVAADIKEVTITNNGIIAGGGGASLSVFPPPYTPGNGGAPFGRGGVTYTSYSGGYKTPFKYGTAAGLTTGVNGGGAIGKKGTGHNGTYPYYPGFYYRGCSNVTIGGTGTYIGPRDTSETLAT